MKTTYKIIIQCGMATKSFTVTATDAIKAYRQAESIVNPKYVITDILPL